MAKEHGVADSADPSLRLEMRGDFFERRPKVCELPARLRAERAALGCRGLPGVDPSVPRPLLGWPAAHLNDILLHRDFSKRFWKISTEFYPEFIRFF